MAIGDFALFPAYTHNLVNSDTLEWIELLPETEYQDSQSYKER